MKIGLTCYDMPAGDVVELARAADKLGFASFWLGEHVVLPVGFTTSHPSEARHDEHHHAGPIVQPDTELVDPLVTLGAAAAVTSSIRLATGIFVLPLRHPLGVARAACTLQDLADGRFTFGIGTGWLVDEFTALDVPFSERVGRFEESVDVMRRAWAAGPLDHHGRFFDFSDVQVTSRPTAMPLILGGNSERALDRAVRLGDGWFSSGTPVFDEAVRLRHDLLRRHAEAPEPAAETFELVFRFEGSDSVALSRYEDAGFDHMVVWADRVWPVGQSLRLKRDRLAEAAGALGVG